MFDLRATLKRIMIFTIMATIVAMIFPVIPTKAETVGDEAPIELRELSRQLEENRDKDPFAFRQSTRRRLLRNTLSSLPESYDLRNVDTNGDGTPDRSYITGVKNQYPFGTCWGFAAIAASESSLISSGLASDDIDLSEKHLCFFINQTVDKDCSQKGEGRVFLGEKGSNKIYMGGDAFYATGLFSSGAGPVKESDNEEFEYHGKNKRTDEYGYIADDDWWIDDKFHYEQDYILTESNIFPNPAAYLNDKKLDDNTRWAYFNQSVEALKKELMERRAIQLGYRAPNALPGEELKNDYINTETWAHYTYKKVDGNHMVTVVGWDDNYPKENFEHLLSGNEYSPIPENDGAWLCKNSWGSGEEEFPNKDDGTWGLLKGQDKGVYNEETRKWEYYAVEGAKHTGYFWLSYEDLSVDTLESLEFDNEKEGTYYIAQYDYLPVYEVNAAYENNKVKMANVFEVRDFTNDESVYIDHVSCQTCTPGTRVDYKIYRLKSNNTSPEDGELIAEWNNYYEFGGFHKQALPEPVLLNSYERFSVIITQKAPDDRYVFNYNYCTNRKYHDEKDPNGLTCGKGIVNIDESFINIDGNRWYDLFNYQDELNGDSGYYDCDNFPIKAYLTPSDDPEPVIVIPKAQTGLVYNNEDFELVEPMSIEGVSDASIYYGLADEEGNVNYGTEIPKAGKPGDYRVYYRATSSLGYEITGGYVDVSIAPKEVGISWSDNNSWKYDNEPHGPAVILSGVIAGDDVRPVFEGNDQTDAGDHTKTIKGLTGDQSEYYCLPETGLSCNYEITVRTVILTSGSADMDYSGEPLTCHDDIAVSGDGFVDGEGVDVSITGSRTAPGESPNIFTYTFKEGTKAGNYDITTMFGSLRVGWWDEEHAKDHIFTVTAQSGEKIYNGEAQYIRGYTCDPESVTIGEETYTLSGLSAETSGTNIGTYENRVTGNPVVKDTQNNDVTSHFAIEKISGILTISAADIKAASIVTDGELTYTGYEQSQKFTVVIDGKTLVRDRDYEAVGDTAKDVGEYTITVTGKGNYAGKISRKYTISKAKLSGISISQSVILIYNGYDQLPMVNAHVDQSNVVFTYARTADSTYASGLPLYKEAGGHVVYYKAEKTGYESVTGSFTITIKPSPLGIKWTNLSIKYDGESHLPTATPINVKGNDSLQFELSGSSSQVGTHIAKVIGIKGSDAGNYSLPEDDQVTFEIYKTSGSSTGTVVDLGTARRNNTEKSSGSAKDSISSEKDTVKKSTASSNTKSKNGTDNKSGTSVNKSSNTAKSQESDKGAEKTGDNADQKKKNGNGEPDGAKVNNRNKSAGNAGKQSSRKRKNSKDDGSHEEPSNEGVNSEPEASADTADQTSDEYSTVPDPAQSYTDNAQYENVQDDLGDILPWILIGAVVAAAGAGIFVIKFRNK